MPHTAPSHYPVLIIGGGQAGLSMSYLLKQQGIGHLIIEQHLLGHAWRSERWDSFCLVTPNWQCALPGFPYDGDDPDGFMVKDQIVDYMERYIASFNPPALEQTTVQGVRRDAAGLFEVDTSRGRYTAGQVVVAVGGYHIPITPAAAASLAPSITQLHSAQYQNPQTLPAGAVLVVATGQSGAQIAEDLHLAGRRVRLCVGDAPRVARRYRGKDVVAWLDEMKYYELPVDRHPLGNAVRDKTNHYVTGRDGGRDIDLRAFARDGMQLYGRFHDIVDGVAHFGDDLRRNLDGADTSSDNIKDSIDKHIAVNGIAAPAEARYVPVWEPAADAPRQLNLGAADIAAVIWCIGFRTDFRWIASAIFDGRGYPEHTRGITAEPGLFFLGLPWQYTWGSGRFSGVARDAAHLLGHLQQALPASRAA